MFLDVSRLIQRQAIRSGVPANQIGDFDEIEIQFVDMATAVKDGKATVLAIKQGRSITLRESDDTVTRSDS